MLTIYREKQELVVNNALGINICSVIKRKFTIKGIVYLVKLKYLDNIEPIWITRKNILCKI